uniref:N-acyltyrosine synthase n=1 Tax=uncultured bacterium SA343_p TaxID=1552128 RepID=A0A0K0LBE0_9BACT|nr:N-acyltyrosine synthase [uncultured bacterium SA343_p]
MQETTAFNDTKLVLKIAETQSELEACFHLLHEAYVANNFMEPHPSELRVTPYHALPTTTTLCAIYDGEVVGTISLIRDGVFGFPMQKAFDLHGVRERGGQIAEVSALAVHPRFRRTVGLVVMPLMKFMYGYCTRYFDTRHLVIAVNPSHIVFYESLLMFQRLFNQVVECYGFVNGAPAVGATLDLIDAPDLMRAANASKAGKKRDLAHYFLNTELPNIQWPSRRYHITNDPVMTPALIDHFFNERTDTFQTMDRRQTALLHSIYDSTDYRDCLPKLTAAEQAAVRTRRYPRYSLHCPGEFSVRMRTAHHCFTLDVVDVSEDGFQARTPPEVPMATWGQVDIELGPATHSSVTAATVRRQHVGDSSFVSFRLNAADSAWTTFTKHLSSGTAHHPA